MTDSIVAGLWAGYGVAVPVGAVAVLMVDMTARTSFRTGAAAAMGAASADALYAVAAVLGGAALAGALQPYAGTLRVVAAAVLVAMAVRIAVTAPRSRGKADTPIRPARAYLTYLGLTVLNPWPAVYFVALVLGRQAQGASADEEAAYVLAVVAASASWQLLLAGGGAALGRTLTGPRGRLVTAVASSVLITLMALKMVHAG
ncbi:LysE family transporter [Pseudonocardia acaciae]|uniref:LysE family transporter n=1 Tax=Pseudonocardia acaciae TaxID=551276 RepID=UPI00048B3403|nr:LysE family transporter [Pseudonocardia acaciae]